MSKRLPVLCLVALVVLAGCSAFSQPESPDPSIQTPQYASPTPDTGGLAYPDGVNGLGFERVFQTTHEQTLRNAGSYRLSVTTQESITREEGGELTTNRTVVFTHDVSQQRLHRYVSGCSARGVCDEQAVRKLYANLSTGSPTVYTATDSSGELEYDSTYSNVNDPVREYFPYSQLPIWTIPKANQTYEGPTTFEGERVHHFVVTDAVGSEANYPANISSVRYDMYVHPDGYLAGYTSEIRGETSEGYEIEYRNRVVFVAGGDSTTVTPPEWVPED